jgi:hypothetical protein
MKRMREKFTCYVEVLHRYFLDRLIEAKKYARIGVAWVESESLPPVYKPEVFILNHFTQHWQVIRQYLYIPHVSTMDENPP